MTYTMLLDLGRDRVFSQSKEGHPNPGIAYWDGEVAVLSFQYLR